MKRNKWKRAYDIRCENLLGMSQQTAMAKLERKLLFHLLKEAGRTKCYHCPFDIESEETMSVEHIEPWGGNKAKELEADPKKFWDLQNLTISHKRCNTSAANAGTGKFKYFGVNYVRDTRKKNPVVKARAAICINGIPMTLGEYLDPKHAAIAHDLALSYFENGIGRLNFENLRDVYKAFVQENVKNEEFFRVRNNQLKPAVDVLKDLLKGEEVHAQSN